MALAALLAVAPAASAQEYPGVERKSLYVPVRDGTRLAVNIYRPAGENGTAVQKRLPVIFVFTPYRARFVNAEGRVEEVALSDSLALRSLLKAGYVVAVADIRGKGASFGSRRGFQDRTEAQDGYDLVEWLAAQSFSSGAVGMVGCSYLGGTTMHTASMAPPSLRAIFTGATDWDKYEFVRRGGITAQFNTRPDEPLSDDLASVPVDADKGGELLRQAVAQHAQNTPMAGLWYSMPYRDSVSPLTGNAFWEEAAIWRYADAIRDAGIATYFWSNWKDEPTGQVIVAAENLGSRLLIGPGSHCVPPKGFDFTGEIRRYFDFHLKGISNGFDEQPPVTYWSSEGGSEGRYVRADKLPGNDASTLAYYLSAGESGDLSLSARPGSNAGDDFVVDYDVANDEYFPFWPEPLDEHGIGYTSAPLQKSLDLLGYPVAHLEVAADRPDADVFVYLEQVAPGGNVEVLSFGRLKISHRATAEAPWNNLGLPWHSGRQADVAPLPAGETARISVAMMPLSHRFEAGSRLRFVVTGADPRQRNLAELRQDPAPRITIRRGWESGSRIDLPLRPAASKVADSGTAGAGHNQIGEVSGSGPHPAIAQVRDDAPGYTVYRPQRLPGTPLPLVLWGNGGCRDNGLSASHALREFASHGFIVVANGAPHEEQPVLDALPPTPPVQNAPPAAQERKADETTVAQLLSAIDWANAVNADPGDPLYGQIDTSRVAAMGHSCGGLQALAAGADPRIDTVVAFGSGVYNRPAGGLSGVQITKDDLKRLHTPVAYILGGPSDIAYPNGTDDFERISHVPVMLANLPVGHGGTFALANGGEWARVGAQWIKWHLTGDEDAAREFAGPDCRLCRTTSWTVERKGMEGL
jgi:predicted acyl esterase